MAPFVKVCLSIHLSPPRCPGSPSSSVHASGQPPPPSPSLLVGGRYNDEKQRLTAENKALQSYLKEEKAARQREAAELKATHGENLKSVNKKWKGVVEATKNQHAAVVRRLERKIIDLEQGVSASSSE